MLVSNTVKQSVMGRGGVHKHYFEISTGNPHFTPHFQKQCYAPVRLLVNNNIISILFEWLYYSLSLIDVPNATIFKETIVYCGSSTELSAQISSCPSPDEVKWQRSSDGNSFNYIDIDEPEYFRSTNDTLSPLLRIPKATFDVQL